MLGRLRLTVDQAIAKYGDFGKRVFSDKKWKVQDGTFKATNLENVIKQIVKDCGGHDSATEPMLDPRPENEVCKTYDLFYLYICMKFTRF
jgi:hypothetical protein